MPKIIVITGASDGIGAAAARQLHKNGHQVVLVGRSPQKTQAIAFELGVRSYTADFTRLADVRQLAADLHAAYPQIDVLANNAGGVFGDRTRTVDGFEKTFQVNHLAPFLLTHLLMDRLLASKASIIQTSSLGARLAGHLVMQDLEHERDFRPTLAYGTAKLANILFTQELQRRYGAQGIAAAAFHPGNVSSNFALGSQSFLRHVYRLGHMFMVSPETGAEQLVWLAQTSPGVDWTPGAYYEKGRVAKKVNPQTRDPNLARQLWERSEQLLGIAR